MVVVAVVVVVIVLVVVVVASSTNVSPWWSIIDIYIYIYKIILLFRDSVRSFVVSAQVCDSKNWNCRSNSFVRAPASGGRLQRPSPCRVRSAHRRERTWTDAERDKRKVANIPHFEKEFRRFWLYLNVCSAWIIYESGIISKRYELLIDVWKFEVAFSRAFVLLDVCRA